MPKTASSGGLVYSTDAGRMCPGCRQPIAVLPLRDVARPHATPRGDGIARIRRETGGRGGKTVTVVTRPGPRRARAARAFPAPEGGVRHRRHGAGRRARVPGRSPRATELAARQGRHREQARGRLSSPGRRDPVARKLLFRVSCIPPRRRRPAPLRRSRTTSKSSTPASTTCAAARWPATSPSWPRPTPPGSASPSPPSTARSTRSARRASRSRSSRSPSRWSTASPSKTAAPRRCGERSGSSRRATPSTPSASSRSTGRPMNPMINAGAIATASLVNGRERRGAAGARGRRHVRLCRSAPGARRSGVRIRAPHRPSQPRHRPHAAQLRDPRRCAGAGARPVLPPVLGAGRRPRPGADRGDPGQRRRQSGQRPARRRRPARRADPQRDDDLRRLRPDRRMGLQRRHAGQERRRRRHHRRAARAARHRRLFAAARRARQQRARGRGLQGPVARARPALPAAAAHRADDGARPLHAGDEALEAPPLGRRKPAARRARARPSRSSSCRATCASRRWSRCCARSTSRATRCASRCSTSSGSIHVDEAATRMLASAGRERRRTRPPDRADAGAPRRDAGLVRQRARPAPRAARDLPAPARRRARVVRAGADRRAARAVAAGAADAATSPSTAGAAASAPPTWCTCRPTWTSAPTRRAR